MKILTTEITTPDRGDNPMGISNVSIALQMFAEGGEGSSLTFLTEEGGQTPTATISCRDGEFHIELKPPA